VIDFSVRQPTIKLLSFGEAAGLAVYQNELQDLNGDEVDDLLLASTGFDVGDQYNCGMVHVIFGGFPLNDPPRLVAGPGPASPWGTSSSRPTTRRKNKTRTLAPVMDPVVATLAVRLARTVNKRFSTVSYHSRSSFCIK
jgi:hypothetical protein